MEIIFACPPPFKSPIAATTYRLAWLLVKHSKLVEHYEDHMLLDCDWVKVKSKDSWCL